MPDPRVTLGLLLLTACTSRPPPADTEPASSSDEGASAGEADTAEAPTGTASGSNTTDAAPTSGTTDAATSGTTAPPTSGTTDAVTTDPSTGTTTADTASSGDPEASSTGEPVVDCLSRCDRTTTLDGDLIVFKGDDTTWLQCVTHVTGNVNLFGDLAPSALANLADLQHVGGEINVTSNELLTDLNMLGCLQTAGTLTLQNLPGIDDLSPLAALEQVGRLSIIDTEITTLASLPTLKGVRGLHLTWNPGLVDLKGVEGWQITPDKFSLSVSGNDNLTSIAAVEPLLAQAAAADPLIVHLSTLTGLTSLAGLEPMTHGFLTLTDLPQIVDLEPLAQSSRPCRSTSTACRSSARCTACTT